MEGFDFTPSTDLSLTALGFWDEGSNGLPRSFQVGLWETTSQTLLGSALIDTTDPLDPSVTVAGGQWRYETLTSPIALSAGTVYTLAFQVGSPTLSTADTLMLDYPTLVTDPNVVVPNTRRFLDSGGVFAFPTSSTSDVIVGNVNAQVEAAAPEPTSLTLLGLALVGMGARRWRQRKAA